VVYRVENWHRYYARHREEIIARRKIEYARDREKILAREAEYRRRNPPWKRVREKRLAVIREFGGRCCKCGFNDWRALQFDHREGGGGADRQFHRHNTLGYYEYVRRNLDRFQLLCANCNWIKRFERLENARPNGGEYEDEASRVARKEDL